MISLHKQSQSKRRIRNRRKIKRIRKTRRTRRIRRRKIKKNQNKKRRKGEKGEREFKIMFIHIVIKNGRAKNSIFFTTSIS